jgi:hypothetical protein
LNKLLQVNKKLLLFLLLGIIVIFFATIILNKTDISLNQTIKKKSTGPNFDIINPSFTINNKQKISVKAEKGNFISDQKILLENNVMFKSSKFKIQTNKAIYNKLNQEVNSNELTRFQSEGTMIISEGFEITENGNIIFFNGRTKLNLDKQASK